MGCVLFAVILFVVCCLFVCSLRFGSLFVGCCVLIEVDGLVIDDCCAPFFFCVCPCFLFLLLYVVLLSVECSVTFLCSMVVVGCRPMFVVRC